MERPSYEAGASADHGDIIGYLVSQGKEHLIPGRHEYEPTISQAEHDAVVRGELSSLRSIHARATDPMTNFELEAEQLEQLEGFIAEKEAVLGIGLPETEA